MKQGNKEDEKMAVVDIEALHLRRFETMKDRVKSLEDQIAKNRAKVETFEFVQNAAIRFCNLICNMRHLRELEQNPWAWVPFSSAWRTRRDFKKIVDEGLGL